MPFAAPSFQQQDDLKKKDGDQGVNISGNSTSFSTGIPGQEAAGGQKAQSGSGDKFANIQSYLDVNKDQGDQMGQKIQSDVTQNADTAKTNIDSFASKAPEVKAYDPNEAYKNVTSLSDSDKAAYNQAKQGYKGPQSLDQVDGYQNTQKSVSKAANQVSNAGNEQGQQQLLKDAYKRPSYSAGENALDQTIVQNSPNSRKGFEDITQKYAGLNSMFDQTAQNVGTNINNSIAQSLKNQQAISKGESEVIPGLINPIKARAEQARLDGESLNKRVTDDLADDPLGFSQEVMDLYGLNEGQEIYGTDLSSLFNKGIDISTDTMATPEEYSKYKALTDLIGSDSGELSSSKSGAAKFAGVDKESVKKAIESAKDPYIQKRAQSEPIGISASTLPGLEKMTPWQIENEVIPGFKARLPQANDAYRANLYREGIAQAQSALDQWKSNAGKQTAVRRKS